MGDHLPERMHDMMNGMMGWGWLGAVLGLLILLLIVALLTAGLAYLLRALRRPHPGGADSPDTPGESQRALQILEERYARGEIDHEDYEQRRRTLRS
ncbi:MAG: SHOCT domain-containing protein [Actinomycetota bacterium]|nr:SHOCT domain-containing protein [Actinomycetota bacterium]